LHTKGLSLQNTLQCSEKHSKVSSNL
jgi:hypothetical protein